jgi:hypothetical protein
MKIGREAVEAARSGGDALDTLIAELWPEAYRLAFGILRDRGLAEDAAQEACATIAARLNSLRGRRCFRGVDVQDRDEPRPRRSPPSPNRAEPRRTTHR